MWFVYYNMITIFSFKFYGNNIIMLYIAVMWPTARKHGILIGVKDYCREYYNSRVIACRDIPSCLKLQC